MTNYERMILEEIPGSTPREQYENLMKMQKKIINLNAKVEQAKTFCRGLIDTPGLENIQSIIEANHWNLCKE